ncbi:MAG: transposase family protein [Blastochloris sp.]|nr:transposase family protein [Blastochloris sp.]
MNTATCFDLEQLLSFGAGCRLQNVTIDADQLRLVVVTTQPSATCPDCATPATRIRGRSTRTLADLPWGVAD